MRTIIVLISGTSRLEACAHLQSALRAPRKSKKDPLRLMIITELGEEKKPDNGSTSNSSNNNVNVNGKEDEQGYMCKKIEKAFSNG